MTAKNNFVFARIIAEMGRQLFFFVWLVLNFFFVTSYTRKGLGTIPG